jgi:hypothetical protein
MVLKQNRINRYTVWLIIWGFIIFYPIIASIYGFSPPLLGAMSYFMIQGFERKKIIVIFSVAIYMINIDINLSLPLFLSIFTTLFIYLVLYPKIKILNNCKVCIAVIVIVLFNLVYIEMLMLYSFVFQSYMLDLDIILIAYLIFDLILVFIV